MEALYGATPPTEVRVTDAAKAPSLGEGRRGPAGFALDSGPSQSSDASPLIRWIDLQIFSKK